MDYHTKLYRNIIIRYRHSYNNNIKYHQNTVLLLYFALGEERERFTHRISRDIVEKT